MNRRKTLVLVLGPFPILGLSVALTNWARPEGHSTSATNQVLMSSVAAAEPVGRIEAASQKPHPLAAPCRAAAERLSKLIGDDCHVISRPPFVLAGDMSVASLEKWRHDTIAPAAEAMANCYFHVPPSEPITVLLFTGEASYNHYAERLFNEHDISVYGYYKPDNRTLVMNIGTGGGTLVHELTHALIAFDFPQVPDWFNEGLASLHEQCRFRDGDDGPWIEGVENWRLPGLQAAIRKQRLRSVESLLVSDDFRGADEGSNYAEARYLCLYLQRKDKLKSFYREFHARQQTDPRGAKSLLKQFPGKTWGELDRDFQTWVLTLEQ